MILVDLLLDKSHASLSSALSMITLYAYMCMSVFSVISNKYLTTNEWVFQKGIFLDYHHPLIRQSHTIKSSVDYSTHKIYRQASVVFGPLDFSFSPSRFPLAACCSGASPSECGAICHFWLGIASLTHLYKRREVRLVVTWIAYHRKK